MQKLYKIDVNETDARSLLKIILDDLYEMSGERIYCYLDDDRRVFAISDTEFPDDFSDNLEEALKLAEKEPDLLLDPEEPIFADGEDYDDDDIILFG